MYKWFQDLNDHGKRWFDFRGAYGSDYRNIWFKYQICSKFDVQFSVRPGSRHDDEGGTSFTIGFLFFTLYLTIPWIRKIPLLKNGRRYGFYFMEWSFVLNWGSSDWESNSKDPWYYYWRFDIPQFFFGEMMYFEKELMKAYNPQKFMFRGKEYTMDKLIINRSCWFRRRVPYALFRHEILRMELEIKKPPLHAGKGENSWDCGDDGTYGTCQPYEGPEVTHKNQKAVWAWCVEKYCDDAMANIAKRGRAANDQDLDPKTTGFLFIGYEHPPVKDTADGDVAVASQEET